MVRTNQTRIEPVDAESLDGLDASNEPHTDTLAPTVSDLQDQIDIETDDQAAAIQEESDLVEELTESVDAEDAGDELIPADEYVEEDDKTVDEAEPQMRRILDEEPVAADDKDDLKRIKGVGPAIEKTLNELGIFSFDQIAEMSEYEIDRVAQRLKGFRSRIYRQDWIGQARDLQYQKTTNLT
jgi:NADH-quinone oxidoreductase subunit E